MTVMGSVMRGVDDWLRQPETRPLMFETSLDNDGSLSA